MITQPMNPFRVWAIDQHRNTNHLYDKIIPYEYHLHMVAREVVRHLEYAIAKGPVDTSKYPNTILGLSLISQREILVDAAYGHDLIEDTRNTYNDVLQAGSGYEVARIIYALTDEKGMNRAERGSKEHYEKLVQVPGAAFVKFCDRIANARYSKFAESSMFDKYKKEHPEFVKKCYMPGIEPYGLVATLDNLFA